MISHIVAIDHNHGIGIKGQLPWHLPQDLKRFKRLTMGATILMGRKTWDSIGRPLPGRKSVVVSRQERESLKLPQEVELVDDVVYFCRQYEKKRDGADPTRSDLYVIGGAEIYAATLELTSRIFLTRVGGSYATDTFYPWPENDAFALTHLCEFRDGARSHPDYSVETWERR